MNWRVQLDARFASLARFAIRFRWLTIVVSLFVVGGLASQIRQLEFDTSTEGFLHDDDPVLVEYNAFRDQFGRDELIVSGGAWLVGLLLAFRLAAELDAALDVRTQADLGTTFSLFLPSS